MRRNRIALVGIAAAAWLAGGTAATAATPGLMKGLDGGHYLPYKPSVVRETQQKLEQKGLYEGKIDGVLGPATMRATAEFQKQNRLHVSGVPTPRTRQKLATG